MIGLDPRWRPSSSSRMRPISERHPDSISLTPKGHCGSCPQSELWLDPRLQLSGCAGLDLLLGERHAVIERPFLFDMRTPCHSVRESGRVYH